MEKDPVGYIIADPDRLDRKTGGGDDIAIAIGKLIQKTPVYNDLS